MRETRELPSVTRRLTAGQMLLRGDAPEEVAKCLQLFAPTIRRYQALLRSGGLDALKKLQIGGRVSVLDEEAYTWIASALGGSAKLHGFESDAWTNARLRAVIEARIGVRFSRVYVWQIASKLGLGHRLSKSRR